MKMLATLTTAATLVAAFGFAANAANVMLVVNNDFPLGDPGSADPTCGLTAPAPFTDDIQIAINAVGASGAPGHSSDIHLVIVCPGVYVGAVDANVEGLELRGLKGAVTGGCLIKSEEPTQPCIVVPDMDEDAITISEDEVTVQGFKVTGCATKACVKVGPDNRHGIHVMSTGNLVRKNTFLNNGDHGIFIATTGSDNKIEDNNVHDNDGDGIHDEGLVHAVEHDEPDDHDEELHVAHDATEDPFHPLFAKRNKMTDNKVHDSGGDGFEFVPLAVDIGSTEVNGNRSRKNGECGFKGAAVYDPTGAKETRNRTDTNGTLLPKKLRPGKDEGENAIPCPV